MNEKQEPTNYDNTNRGALFKNDKQGNENRPDFTGKLNVEGKEYKLAGWRKEGPRGSFLSLKATPAPPAAPLDDDREF